MTPEATSRPAGQPRPLNLTLSVQDRTIIDATIDNTVSIAGQNGDESTAEQGRIIRQAGWAAAGHHPKSDQGWGGWSPLDEHLSIEWPATTWQFIVGQLRRWDEGQHRQPARRQGPGSEESGAGPNVGRTDQLSSPSPRSRSPPR